MKKILTFGISALMIASFAAPALAARAHAICRDNTISYSVHRSGTCSWHHGVKKWLY